MNANSEVGTLGTGNLVRLKEMNEFVLLRFCFSHKLQFIVQFSSKEDMHRYAMTWVQLDWKEDCEGPNSHKSTITNCWSEWLSMQRIVLVWVFSQSLFPEALLGQAVNKLFWAHRNSFNPWFFLEQVPDVKCKIIFSCGTRISYLHVCGCWPCDIPILKFYFSLRCFSSFWSVMHSDSFMINGIGRIINTSNKLPSLWCFYFAAYI